MSSIVYNFTWETYCALLDEDEVRFYQTLEQGHIGDYICIKVRVRHELCVNPPQYPSLILPFDWVFYAQTMFVPYHEFHQNSLLYMQTYFSNAIIPYEVMYTCMPQVMTYIDNVRNSYPNPHYESPRIRVLPLVLDISVRMLFENHNDFVTNMAALVNTMGETQFVPATKDAIESLEKVKVEDCDTMKMCVICQVEFNIGMEVTKMPCDHLYHHECIVQWLETSHMCPMCRHPLPTSTSG